MVSVLKQIFCYLSVLCVAASIVLGIIFGIVWFFGIVGVAALFAGLMFGMKRLETPKAPPKTDFMNSDEENKKILDDAKKDE